MCEKRLVDANALCQHIQDWKTRCQELHRHSVGMYHMMIYEVLCQVLDVINDTPTVDPESLRPKTSMKYDALTSTVTCRNCSGEVKLGEYDNPEDFRYCPFCGFKVEGLTYDVY